MKTNALWEKFSTKMCDIQQFYRLSQKAFDIEFNELAKLHDSIQEDRFLFDNLISKNREVLGFKSLSLDEAKLEILLRRNRNYQWLLVQAFEEYEDFIFNLIALSALQNPIFWDGNNQIKIDALIKNGLDWFINEPKTRKGNLKDKLNKIRCVLKNELISKEVGNKNQLNFRLVISMIEKFRHLIVHNAGNFMNKEKFLREIVRDNGISVDGKNFIEFKKFIELYIGGGAFENVIYLLETPENLGRLNSLLNLRSNPLSLLSEHLTSHGHLVFELVNNYIKTDSIN